MISRRTFLAASLLAPSLTLAAPAPEATVTLEISGMT